MIVIGDCKMQESRFIKDLGSTE